MVKFLAYAALAASAWAAAVKDTTTRRADVDCTGVNAININCKSSEAPCHRDQFYVGGRSLNATTGTLTVDQLYVEKLTPLCDKHKPNPLVFIHGGGIADSNSIGRSSENDLASFTMVADTSNENMQIGFTVVELYNYYPQAVLHTQWPGSGQNGDPIFDNFKKTFIPLTSSYIAQEKAMRLAGCQLLSLLGANAYIISHSLGSRFPILMSNDCPQYIAASINIEAASVPFWSYGYGLGGTASTPYGFTWTAVDYEPAISNSSELVIESVGEETLAKRNCYRQKEPARQLPKIASVPYLMVTSEASVHVTYDHCIVDYLKQVGGNPDFIKLADIGIHGNSHFMHVEKNNLDIAAVVKDWIEKH